MTDIDLHLLPGGGGGPEGPRAHRDGDADPDWARFLAPRDTAEFVHTWFSLLCRDMPGLSRAVLLLETTEGHFAPAARWPQLAAEPDPDDPAVVALQTACAAAQSGGETTLRPAGPDERAIGYPVLVEGHAQAVIGLILRNADCPRALAAVQWGAGWLHGVIKDGHSTEAAARTQDLSAAVTVLAALEDGDTLEAALRALTNESQAVLGADRVSVALLRRGRLRLRALSQTADVERKSTVTRSLTQAMEEARLQVLPIRLPAVSPTAITAAHVAHAAASGVQGMVSLPMMLRGRLLGVLSAERMATGTPGGTFSDAEMQRLQAIADLAAPAIALKQAENRLVSGRLRRWTGTALTAVFGRRHPGVKLGLLLGLALAVWLGTAQTTLRVTAQARLEGAVSRVATAPFAGFVDTSRHRAGALVSRDEVLATLDDRDLRLDLIKWQSERAKLTQERNAALAEGDRAKLGQLAAQIARVDAEIRLAQSRLDRIEIRAPFDGLIVEGDLTQRLGAPVDKGEALFRIAAGDTFRLALDVSEYDVRLVEPGATGTLALTGLSRQAIRFEVTRLAEVAEAARGQTAFRAEATLIDPPAGLRPGLQGVAKIDAGTATIASALWRPIGERTRIWFWRWRP